MSVVDNYFHACDYYYSKDNDGAFRHIKQIHAELNINRKVDSKWGIWDELRELFKVMPFGEYALRTASKFSPTLSVEINKRNLYNAMTAMVYSIMQSKNLMFPQIRLSNAYGSIFIKERKQEIIDCIHLFEPNTKFGMEECLKVYNLILQEVII